MKKLTSLVHYIDITNFFFYNYLMKKFLLILILTLSFQSWTNADNVKDFQIEGISVGDSLLNFYSEKKIKRFEPLHYPNSKKFYQIVLLIENGKYDALNINLKEGDKKYIVHSIKGLKSYDNRHKDCLEEKKNLIGEISSIVKNAKKIKYESNYSNRFGKSFAIGTTFQVSNGSFTAFCAKWDKKNKEIISRKWIDTLNVIMATAEWTNWLDYEAY